VKKAPHKHPESPPASFPCEEKVRRKKSIRMYTEEVQVHTANTIADIKLQKQSDVQSGMQRVMASSDRTTRHSDTLHSLTPPTERGLGGR